MGLWDGLPPPLSIGTIVLLPYSASSCYFKSVPRGETGPSPRKGRTVCASQTNILAWRQSPCVGAALSRFSLAVSQAVPARTERHLSIPVPAPPALISKSPQRARCFCSPRRRGCGEPLPRGARVHFTPLKSLCPSRRQHVTSTALPENGPDTPVMSVGASFRKASTPETPARAIHSQTARGGRAGGLPPAPGLGAPRPRHTPTAARIRSFLCVAYTARSAVL